MKKLTFSLAALVALLASACNTTFTGDAYFPGGPAGCSKKCAAEGMVMSSYVYAGDYSTACVCALPNAHPQAAAEGVVPPAVGVIMQTQRAQAQMAQQASTPAPGVR